MSTQKQQKPSSGAARPLPRVLSLEEARKLGIPITNDSAADVDNLLLATTRQPLRSERKRRGLIFGKISFWIVRRSRPCAEDEDECVASNGSPTGGPTKPVAPPIAVSPLKEKAASPRQTFASNMTCCLSFYRRYPGKAGGASPEYACRVQAKTQPKVFVAFCSE